MSVPPDADQPHGVRLGREPFVARRTAVGFGGRAGFVPTFAGDAADRAIDNPGGDQGAVAGPPGVGLAEQVAGEDPFRGGMIAVG